MTHWVLIWWLFGPTLAPATGSAVFQDEVSCWAASSHLYALSQQDSAPSPKFRAMCLPERDEKASQKQ